MANDGTVDVAVNHFSEIVDGKEKFSAEFTIGAEACAAGTFDLDDELKSL